MGQHPFERNRDPKPQQIQIAGTVVIIGGLKAEYHVMRHQTRQQQHPFDAAMDIYASTADLEVKSLGKLWSKIIVSTALTVTFGPGIAGIIMPRSSSWEKLQGGENISAVIDAHYTGELLICVRCLNDDLYLVSEAIRQLAVEQNAIAQLLLVQCVAPIFAKPQPGQLESLTRGKRGFGSTDGLSPNKT